MRAMLCNSREPQGFVGSQNTDIAFGISFGQNCSNFERAVAVQVTYMLSCTGTARLTRRNPLAKQSQSQQHRLPTERTKGIRLLLSIWAHLPRVLFFSNLFPPNRGKNAFSCTQQAVKERPD